MKTILLLVVFLLFFDFAHSQNSDDVVLAKKINLHSEILKEQLTVFVSTPINYSSSNKSYPILYILDGSEIIVGYASGIVNSLAENGIIPEMIIVAIGTNNRKRDFTPTIPKNIPEEILKNMQPGGADKFLNFIESELFPFVEKKYRTLPYRIFAGHSDGGLCVTHAFTSHNNLFNSYIAISPSVAWDSNFEKTVIEQNIQKMNLKRKQFFISVGGKERPESIQGVNVFANVLVLYAPEGFIWKMNYNENEDHYSQATIGLYNGLRFLYNDWKIDYEILAAHGLEAIKKFYKNNSEKYGYEVIPEANALIYMGMDATRLGQQEEALKIFTYNTIIHPTFPEAFSCLGNSYIKSGNNSLVIKNFEKAVELAITLKDDNLERYKNQLRDILANQKN